MKTRIEEQFVRNRRMLTVAAALLYVGSVFQITADKWAGGIICFLAATCFASFERACCGKEDETDDNGEKEDNGETDEV